MKLNRLALIYIAVVVFAFLTVREILHSEKFARFVSGKVTNFVNQNVEGDFSVRQIRLEVFPFGMVLDGVKVDTEQLEVELGRVDVNYGLANIFRSNVTIKEVLLSEARVRVKHVKNSKKTETITQDTLLERWRELFNLIASSPVVIQNLEFKRFVAITEQTTFEIPILKLSQKKNYLNLITQIENIDLSFLKLEMLKNPDSLNLEVELSPDKINLKDASLVHGLTVLSASGAVHLDSELKFENTRIVLKGPDNFLQNYISNETLDELNPDGFIDMSAVLNGLVENPSIEAKGEIQYLTSKYLNGEKLKIEALVENKKLSIGEITIYDKSGFAKITSNQTYELSKDILEKGIAGLSVELNNLESKTIFHFLEGKLDPFVSNLTGKLEAQINEKRLSIQTSSSLFLNNFQLMLSKEAPLIAHKSIELQKMNIDLTFNKFNLDIKGNLRISETVAQMQLKIDGSGIKANLKSEKFVFDNLKKIQEVDMSGQGPLNVSIVGPWDNVVFNFDGVLENAIVAGYELGKVNLTGILPIREKVLKFPLLDGRKSFTQYNGSVQLKLDGSSYPLEISFNSPRATLNDLKEIIKPIIPASIATQNELRARFKTSGKVNVDFKNRPVKLDIEVEGDSLSVAGEYFDGFGASIKMSRNRLNIKDFNLKREGVTGRGAALWDTESSYLEYEFAMSGLSLTSFNLYRLAPLALEGFLDIDIYGSGLLNNDHSLRSTVFLRDSTIKRTKVENSRIDAYYSKGELTLQAELLEGLARGEAFLPLDIKKRGLVRLDVTAEKINHLVGLFAPARMNDETLSGKAYAQLQASFPMGELDVADVKVDIRDILISYKGKKAQVKQKMPLIVKKGRFNKWLLTSDVASDLKLDMMAGGDLGDDFHFSSNYIIPGELFELASDRFLDMTGDLDGRVNFSWDKNGIQAFLNHNARNLQFRLKDIPGRFSNMMLDASYKEKVITVHNVSGNYGRGTFQSSGKIVVQFPYPSISIKTTLSDISYPLFNRSNATFDSRLSLVGSRPPYLFSGQVILQKVELTEDVGTYLGQVSGGSSYERFIPNTTQSLINQYIEIDLSVFSNAGIRVANPLMSMVLDTRIKLKGEMMSPQLDGTVSGVPRRSKISFKGHEFELNKAVVTFDPATGPAKSIIDLSGRTAVSGYKIDLLVSGPVDQMNIALSSDPALPQDEIVSLLTLGITSDISRSLNEEDRRSITTMSLGGFLFDQLQLTRGLDSNLGLKVSLAPEFSSDEGNLIEEASSDTTTAKRLKTGTKLRVQSQLGKKTSVEFSSTLGGEIEQKQEMNLNYDFNRSWSVEGIYELKSSTEEDQGDSQSLGADVKYRWSF